MRISHGNLIADALDKAPDGLTCEQISAALGGKLDSVQVNRCMAAMERDGIAERSLVNRRTNGAPIYECRWSKSGRRMAIWFKVRIAHG